MKVDKALFKSIVKECLVEILSEGLSPKSDSQKEITESFDRRVKRSLPGAEQIKEAQQKNLQTRGSYLDQVNFGTKPKNKDSENNPEKTKNLVSRVTNDPIMRDILADTASSTLREQYEVPGRTSVTTSPPDEAAKIVSISDPTDLFGGASEKWASLAFAPKINR